MFKITDGKGFTIQFENGYEVSVQFGSGCYADHRESMFGTEAACGEAGSSTAECAVIDPQRNMVELPSCGDVVTGWSTPEDVLKLMQWAASQPNQPLVKEEKSVLHEFECHLWDGDEIVRRDFKRTYSNIANGRELRATLRAGEYTWPGCYPIYFITSDGAALSFDAVRAELPQVLHSIRHGLDHGWRVIGCNVNYEDAELVCSHTNAPIPAAYASEDDTSGCEADTN